jgi:AcrR family transcriptional regulator
MPASGTHPSPSEGGTPAETEPGRRTRDSLLDAAERCFATYGVTKTTMNDVARRAGLSRPTLYRYFADREALNVGVIMRRSERLVHRAVAYIEQQPTLEDKIVEGLVYLIDHGRRDEVVLDLVAGDSPRAASTLADSDAAWRVTEQVWAPVLGDVGMRPEVRHDDAPEETLLWLVHVQLSMITYLGRRNDREAWDRVRSLVRRFVLPAFLDPEAATAGESAAAQPR